MADDGGVFALGTAQLYGSLGSVRLNAPISAVLASPFGHGYLLVGRDGGIFACGDYPFTDSLSGPRLNAPIVGSSVRPWGRRDAAGAGSSSKAVPQTILIWAPGRRTLQPARQAVLT